MYTYVNTHIWAPSQRALYFRVTHTIIRHSISATAHLHISATEPHISAKSPIFPQKNPIFHRPKIYAPVHLSNRTPVIKEQCVYVYTYIEGYNHTCIHTHIHIYTHTPTPQLTRPPISATAHPWSRNNIVVPIVPHSITFWCKSLKSQLYSRFTLHNT